jgi:hypothetical protein
LLALAIICQKISRFIGISDTHTMIWHQEANAPSTA